jgi:pimeloyl-ACP methyl ester carboxylesterase
VALGALALYGGAREAVAMAVALAPNAVWHDPGDALELPPELVRRGVTRLETAVGPPSAKLVSWLIEPSVASRGTIVLLHGVRMNRRSMLEAGLAFADAGYRSVLVDLRGHGESTGRFLTYGALEAHDISAVLDTIAARGSALGCVGAFGFSYGGAVALELGATDSRLLAVVAVAPFASLREVVADYRQKYLPVALQLIPGAWFEAAVDEASRIAAFDPDRTAPVRVVGGSYAQQLLIHGTADTQVRFRHSLALANAAGPLARLLPIEGASHDNMPAQLIQREAVEWFERWLPERQCSPA